MNQQELNNTLLLATILARQVDQLQDTLDVLQQQLKMHGAVHRERLEKPKPPLLYLVK